MTVHVVDVHDVTHTCPASPHPHPIDSRRSLVHTIPGGPCQRPLTLPRGDGGSAVVACARRQPAEQQCDACRVTVHIRARTSEHAGAVPVGQSGPAVGLAPVPCTTCGQPLAAVLAHVGRHLLCTAATTNTGGMA
jgi:hypothetical protein